MKYKTNIPKNLFYCNLVIIFILTILLTISMLDSVIFGTSIYDEIQDLETFKSKLDFYTIGKIMSYVGNVTMSIGYLIYLMIIRHKIKIGYLFIFSWIIVFIPLASSPFYIKDFDENIFKILINSLITLFNLLLIFNLIFLWWNIRKNRKIQRYEKFKIHSSRKDSK